MGNQHHPGPPPDERRCTGTYSKNHETHPGERCRQWAIKGANVCYHHGGAAPQVRRKAAARVAQAKLEESVAKTLARLEVAPVENPLTELSKVAGQIVAWKDVLAERVNALERIRYQDDKGGEQLRAEVALWERALDRCASVLATIARLNIDERLAAITERQAAVVVAAVEAALAHAGITGEAAVEAKKAAARRLRAVP
jgi:hypothetical protein